MNFKDYPDSLSQIHLRPVFESPWYLGPTIIFYAALVGVGIIVNCVIAGDNFTICWNFSSTNCDDAININETANMSHGLQPLTC